MRSKWFTLFHFFLTAAGIATGSAMSVAQDLQSSPSIISRNGDKPKVLPTQFQIQSNPPETTDAVPRFEGTLAAPSASRWRLRTDYLMWWVEGAPLPIPLVTTGQAEETENGKLGQSTTSILYGADNQDFRVFSGLRATLGVWFDDEQSFGFEASGFLLEKRTAGYVRRGDAATSPVISIPIYNTTFFEPYGRIVGEEYVPACLTGTLVGGVNMDSSLRLSGADANALVGLIRSSDWQTTGLVGFRYLDLFESFDLSTDTQGASFPFLGQSGQASDHFQTRNQFYGGTLGVRGSYTAGRASVDLTARVALGCVHQVLNVRGVYSTVGYTSPGGPIGVFAQPSNSGRFVKNSFGVAPEAQLNFGYDVTSWLHVSAGYDFLYWSSVVRPGDQINRQLPKGQVYQQAGSSVSATLPTPYFNKGDFFAHGLNFAMQVRY